MLPKGVDGNLRLVVHWAILKEEKQEEEFNQGYYIYDFQVKTSLSDSFLQFDYLKTTALGHPPKLNPYFSTGGSPVIIRALGDPIVSTSLNYGDFRRKDKFESLSIAFTVSDSIFYKPFLSLKQHVSFYEANHSKGILLTELNSLAKNAVDQFLESLKHELLGKTPVLALIEKGVIQIKIKSYASETETLEKNEALAEARATAVQSLLEQTLGFPNVQFEIEIVEKLPTSDRADYWHIDNVVELRLTYNVDFVNKDKKN